MKLENKDWNAIWDKQTEDFLNNSNNDVWTADYSEGYDVVKFKHQPDVEFHKNKCWVNDKTGERITSEEFDRRESMKYPIRDLSKDSAIESFRFEILDFGKI